MCGMIISGEHDYPGETMVRYRTGGKLLDGWIACDRMFSLNDRLRQLPYDRFAAGCPRAIPRPENQAETGDLSP